MMNLAEAKHSNSSYPTAMGSQKQRTSHVKATSKGVMAGKSRVQPFDLDGVGSIPAIPPTQITCFVDHFNNLE
jgi:hypothetical protein